MLHRIVTTVIFMGTFAIAAEVPPAFDWNHLHAEAMGAARRQDYQQAVMLSRQLWEKATGDVQYAAAAQDLGTVFHYTGDDREARIWLERALEHWRKVPGNPERLPQTMQAIGVICRRLGDYPAAERFFREALTLPQITITTRANTLTALADLLREQGNLAETFELLRQTRVQPGAPWYTQVEFLMATGGMELETGSAQESAVHWNEALELARANHSSSFEAICLRGLGEAWLERHDVARALPLLRRSVYLFESADMPEPSQKEAFQLANSRRALAEALLLDGKPRQAEELAQRAIEDMEKASVAGHPVAAALFGMLADAKAAQAKLVPALEALSRSEAILIAHFGESSTIAVNTAARRGVLEERAGQAEAAVRDLAEVFQQMDQDRAAFARMRLRLLPYYAAALEATHRKQQAKAIRAEIKTHSVE